VAGASAAIVGATAAMGTPTPQAGGGKHPPSKGGVKIP